jgi:hypothetical protein
MPKFQVECLIHVNAVYLVEAETADAAGDMVQDKLDKLEIAASAVELPELGVPSVGTADAEAIGTYNEGEAIP